MSDPLYLLNPLFSWGSFALARSSRAMTLAADFALASQVGFPATMARRKAPPPPVVATIEKCFQLFA